MELTFLGVGEACDPLHGNTSLLLRADGAVLLLDCGFSVPHRFFGLVRTADELDACYISHFHGDHVFGLPLLLLRLSEMGRRKPLLLVGPPGMEQHCEGLLELAYPGFARRMSYVREYLEMQPDTPLDALGLTWLVAPSEHSLTNLCLRLDGVHHSLGYSGDGRPTSASAELFRNVSLLVHEAFGLDNSIPNHGSVTSCLELVRECGAGRLALVHLGYRTRKEELRSILERIAPWGDRILLPEDGESLML